MTASGSRTITGPTARSGWSTKPLRLTRSLAGWSSTRCPKGASASAMTGVQATRTFAKVQGAMQTALAKGEGVVKGAVQSIARLT